LTDVSTESDTLEGDRKSILKSERVAFSSRRHRRALPGSAITGLWVRAQPSRAAWSTIAANLCGNLSILGFPISLHTLAWFSLRPQGCFAPSRATVASKENAHLWWD